MLTGAPFSDHPSCTHWMLAALARAVNDLVGPDARRSLVTRAPAIARFGPTTEGVAGAVTAAVDRVHRARRVADLVVAEGGQVGLVRRTLRRCRWLCGSRRHLVLEGTDRDTQYRAVLEAVVSVYGIDFPREQERDRVLVGMLDAVLADLERRAGTDQVTRRVGGAPLDRRAGPATERR